MNILDTIMEHKILEVEDRKSNIHVAALEKRPFFSRDTLSLKQFLANPAKTGIIAEFKRRSPSKGVINDKVDVLDIITAYTAHGASGVSILTDEHFFGGSMADVEKARVNTIPILRKDFMIDEYQVVEAKSIGADVILLIAACLSPARVKSLAAFAKSLRLEVLLEIHNEEELQHICAEVDMVGVNNRDLKTFTVDVNRSIALGKQIPAGMITISESGIGDVDTILRLKNAGFKGFLVGENFMKAPDPAMAFKKFTAELQSISMA